MRKFLVLYSSRHAHTQKIARRVGNVIRARGHVVHVVDADVVRPFLRVNTFDAVVAASPVYAGHHLGSIAEFVSSHVDWLASVPSLFISVGLAVESKTTDGVAQSQRWVERFVRETGWRPMRVELVAGALPYTHYGIFTRWMMRMMAARAGADTDSSRDYDYTDWDRVERAAIELAAIVEERVSIAPDVHAAQ